MLLWWIETIRRNPREWYRYHVTGYMSDIKHPEWSGNNSVFSWAVPSLTGSGGKYVFRLREI